MWGVYCLSPDNPPPAGGCPCCKDKAPKTYNSKQFAEKETHIQKLGLTSKQMFLLKSSWKGISSEMQASGVTLFVDIFKSNKEVLNAFPKLNPNLTSSGMKYPKDKAINEAFQEHGLKHFE